MNQLLFNQTEKPIICTANQNGSQADCELGNPFKRDSKVKGGLMPSPLCCCALILTDVCFFNQVTFYIILSTVDMSLDATEIDIELQLQT